ncbi:hypothetical protein ZIOFF_041948 [Zingiber officinale]|uniref:Uncharacterized protein n=1 Tax=Zingiber officinale TaxID=94328 RepID=A0A8J5L5P9_ZINOF|nr:hypothetical protein ZIOFF_041948 [Zingiber officinale]
MTGSKADKIMVADTAGVEVASTAGVEVASTAEVELPNTAEMGLASTIEMELANTVEMELADTAEVEVGDFVAETAEISMGLSAAEIVEVVRNDWYGYLSCNKMRLSLTTNSNTGTNLSSCSIAPTPCSHRAFLLLHRLTESVQPHDPPSPGRGRRGLAGNVHPRPLFSRALDRWIGNPSSSALALHPGRHHPFSSSLAGCLDPHRRFMLLLSLWCESSNHCRCRSGVAVASS